MPPFRTVNERFSPRTAVLASVAVLMTAFFVTIAMLDNSGRGSAKASSSKQERSAEPVERARTTPMAKAKIAKTGQTGCTLRFAQLKSTCHPVDPKTGEGELYWQADAEFANRNGVSLKLDIARTMVKTPRPLIIVLHGGGWWSGERRDVAYGHQLQQKLVRAGYVTASIDYRLTCGNGTETAPSRKAYDTGFGSSSPLCGAHIDDQVEDIHAAIAFLRAHAGQIGVDPDRIGLFGLSAGGHLALLAAAQAKADTRVQAVVNWSGPAFIDDVSLQKPGQRGTIIASLSNAIGCSYSMCPDRWAKADPLRAVDSAKFPFAAFNASSQFEKTVAARSLEVYDKRVADRGWPHEQRIVLDTCHGAGCGVFPTNRVGQPTLLVDSIDFFNRMFTPTR